MRDHDSLTEYLNAWHNGHRDARPEDDYERDFETPPGAVDRVPEHYQGNGMSPFDVVDAFGLDYYEGNVLKYLVRWRSKGGVNDLKKARHYLDEIIRRAENASKQA